MHFPESWFLEIVIVTALDFLVAVRAGVGTPA